MSFPQTQLDLCTELYLDAAGWVDVSGDVMLEPPVQIVRGRQNETSRQTSPAQCTFRLNDVHRSYDPTYPASPYWGVLGRNTPVRVGVRTARDTFARTVSSGWGTADTGQSWAKGGTGWVAGDFNVGSGAATHSVSTPATFRVTWLSGFAQRDVDMKIDVSLSAPASVTGDAIEPANLVLRLLDINNYYMVRVSVAPGGGGITLDLHSVVAGADTSLVGATSTGLAYSAGTTYTVRASIEGQTLKAKLWPAGTGEPYGWTVSVRDQSFPGAGSVGVRSGVAAANTNTPVVFSYDNLDVRSPRFCGEVADISPAWDKTGKKRWVDVEAADIWRRLQAGATPLMSTLKRGTLSITTSPPVAYWPCEDGSEAVQASSALQGGASMEITQGKVNFGAYSGFDCSAPVLTPNNGTLHGPVPEYPDGGGQVRFLIHFPASGLTDGQALCTFHTSGTIARWRVTWQTGGGLKITWYDNTVTYVGDSGVWGFSATDVDYLMSFGVTQSGGDIAWQLAAYTPGNSTGLVASGTVTGRVLGQITDVYLVPDKDISSVSFGHVAVQPVVTSLFDLYLQADAYRTEFCANRIARLAKENGTDSWIYRSPQNPEPWVQMGPQQVKTLVDLIEEAAVAEQGIVYANRANTELQFRTHPSLTAQTPSLQLDYAAGQLAAGVFPVHDDQAVTNDITATRLGGSSTHVSQDTGRMSTLPPSQGGIGVYASELTYNVVSESYLPDVAWWQLHLGTYDGPRYPQISVQLQNPRLAANATLVQQVRDINLGDLATVNNLTTAELERLLILGYRETLGAYQHEFTFNCVPGQPWQVGVSDDAGTRVDASNSQLASPATSSATTLSVADVDGDSLWSTVAGDLPFDIRVTGERMTVTGVSGASSPQTFTVTRSVNGVVKAHSAGETVQLADPVYAAAGIQT